MGNGSACPNWLVNNLILWTCFIEVGEALRVTAHERLGEVLCILKTILKKYPPVNSTDLLTATGVLISKIKGQQQYYSKEFHYLNTFNAEKS